MTHDKDQESIIQPMDRSRNSWRNKSFFLSEINCRAFVRTRERVCDFAPRIFMKWLNKYTFKVMVNTPFFVLIFPILKHIASNQETIVTSEWRLREQDNLQIIFEICEDYTESISRRLRKAGEEGCFLSVLS